MKTNPFSSKHPASPKHFADREDLLGHFRRSIIKGAKARPPKPNNIAILGDWGTGKTSALLKLKDMVLREFKEKVKVLLVPIMLKPASCASIDDFSETIVYKTKSSYEINDSSIVGKIRGIMGEWEVSTIQIPLIKIEKRKKAKIDLTKSLRDLWNSLENRVDMAILMLDDLHYLLWGYPDGLFDLRNTFQELAAGGCNYMIIVTSPKILYKEVGDVAEPLTRFFDPFYLDYFTIEGTREAILKPIEVEGIPIKVKNEVIEKIHSITLGHPYFITFMMEVLLDEVEKKTIDARVFDELYPKIIGRVSEAKFRADFEKASDKEKEVLFKVSESKKELVRPSEIDKKYHPAGTFSRLVNKGLLIKEGRGQYKLYHPLFREFLLEHAKG